MKYWWTLEHTGDKTLEECKRNHDHYGMTCPCDKDGYTECHRVTVYAYIYNTFDESPSGIVLEAVETRVSGAVDVVEDRIIAVYWHIGALNPGKHMGLFESEAAVACEALNNLFGRPIVQADTPFDDLLELL